MVKYKKSSTQNFETFHLFAPATYGKVQSKTKSKLEPISVLYVSGESVAAGAVAAGAGFT